MPRRSLLITVRFHEGRYHGQEDGFANTYGWPPSPGRLFQALVAGAARGASLLPEDECALRWLEELAPPKVVAPATRRGRSVRQFVPNNDLDSVGGDPAKVSEIRVGKQWRPCFFDPREPVLYLWDFEEGATEAARICAIAARLYQLGRGIDPAWACGEVLEQIEAAAVLESHSEAVRQPRGTGETATPRQGTLESLVNRYQGKRRRLTTEGTGPKRRQLFAQPPKAYFGRTGYDAPPRRLHFELRTPGDAFAPRPLASAALLIAGLRTAAAARLQDSLPEQSLLFERLIIGRGAGPADHARRIRLVPIPSIGGPHTDPSIRRILIELPPDCPIRADDIKWAFSGLEPHDPRSGEIWPGRLVSTGDTRMVERFTESACAFRSVTPLALQGALRRRIDPARASEEAKGAAERTREESCAVGAIVQSLRHAGIPATAVDVRVQREPFDGRGERVEAFAAGTRFPKEALWHAAIAVTEPVAGPLLLGDGRYLGLGLMRPNEPMSGVLAFTITGGLADGADPGLIAHAARRAMMARVQAALLPGRTIPSYVSGHTEDGKPLRDGVHRHMAVTADLPRRRILYIAPSRLQRGRRPSDQEKRDHLLVRQALQSMDVLRAGAAGLLVLTPESPDTATDPLFAPGRIWESVSDYRVTRHRRSPSSEETLRADVLAELRRIGWPVPETVRIQSLRRGPGGGLSGRVRLAFAAVQAGPLAIGQTAHKGGGLFANAVP